MSIIRQLSEKPWVTAQGTVEEPHDGGISSLPAVKLGLRLFLAVVTVLFMLLIIAYGSRMASEDWRPGPERSLLWLNTFMLILSSVAMQWAQFSARRRRMDGVKLGLFAGGAFAFAFLTGQVLVWRQLGMSGYFDVTNPAIAFFYLITGLHALHLLGGLVAWGRTIAKLWGSFEAAQVQLSVELCTIYWHFLLLVWLVLFALLFSGNNLSVLLAICGIR